jgi:hypothetical protein
MLRIILPVEVALAGHLACAVTFSRDITCPPTGVLIAWNTVGIVLFGYDSSFSPEVGRWLLLCLI